MEVASHRVEHRQVRTINRSEEKRPILDIMDEFGIDLEERGEGDNGYWIGKCPLHDDNNPSFVVYPESGKFLCFSCHPKAGDVIDFAMAYKGIGFVEAKKICTTELDMFSSCLRGLNEFYGKASDSVDTHELQYRATKILDEPRTLDLRDALSVLSEFDQYMAENRWMNADGLLRTHGL